MFTLKTVSFSVVALSLVGFAAQAQVTKPSPLSETEMASARGKFATGSVVGLDLVMRAEWQDASQGHLSGEMRVQLQPGAANPLRIQSSSQSVAGSGPAASGTPGVIEGGIPVVQGIAQGNQIAGFDNQVTNQFEVTVMEPSQRRPGLAAQSGTHSQASSSAGTVDAGLDDKGIGIRIRPVGGGGTTQRIGAVGPGVGGVQQWAQVPGNHNQVRLTTALELQMRPLGGGEAANQSARQALQLMPQRLR